jgi:hypothetical protein
MTRSRTTCNDQAAAWPPPKIPPTTARCQARPSQPETTRGTPPQEEGAWDRRRPQVALQAAAIDFWRASQPAPTRARHATMPEGPSPRDVGPSVARNDSGQRDSRAASVVEQHTCYDGGPAVIPNPARRHPPQTSAEAGEPKVSAPSSSAASGSSASSLLCPASGSLGLVVVGSSTSCRDGGAPPRIRCRCAAWRERAFFPLAQVVELCGLTSPI